ncbi:glycosyl transferase [Flavobacterium sufflavum]|uniref:Glycosyl transferase n=1 Tax=Flavobacterium sufflavum TaxID=1921138 RepID=A0A3S2XH09_9FLAO|nr:glycosyl transferase [Flavobacterium sufflavum]RVT75307.1 glycosyl transferase [Flavobacterium sufflavum]
MKKLNKVPSYAINLEKRTDRKINILSEFENRKEFILTIIPAIEDEVGSYGLWQTIHSIVNLANEECLEYVLICEDDHQFTTSYSASMLYSAIDESLHRDADVLLGSVSWFDQVLQVDKNLFWVDRFNGTQFMIIFQKFYQKILNIDFYKTDIADMKISSLTDAIFVMYPFISVQKEFGYSDVTQKNNEEGRITELYRLRNEKLMHLDKVATFYGLFS